MDFDYILNSVKNKLNAWSAKHLSYVGRLTLIHLVLNAISSYVMQTTSLPLSLCDTLDKEIRRFLWIGSNNYRKIHIVDWDNCCKSKEEGGLGLRSAKTTNKAFLMKLCFWLHSEADSLWSKLVRGKYLKGNLNFEFVKKRNSSHIWRGICNVLDDTFSALHRVIGNGLDTKFWWDAKIEYEPSLISLVTQQNYVILKDSVVADSC